MGVGKITKRAVDEYPFGARDTYLWDDELKGFGLKVTPKGTRTYLYQYRMGGRSSRTQRYSIGLHGSPWTPSTARAAAQRLAILVAQGVDPVAAAIEKQRLAVDLAFAPYGQRFLASCAGKGWRGLVERTLRLHLAPYLRSKPLNEITRRDISAVLDKMPIHQVALRRNTFAVLRRLCRWAVARGDIDRSPCEGLDTPRAVTPRDRVLTDDELKLVWRVSYDCNPVFGRVIRMLIITGQRREEVTGLDWSELNQSSATWTLARNRSKNGLPHVVPLADLAVAEIAGVAPSKKWPNRGLVFVNSSGNHFTGHAKGKVQIDDKLASTGIKPWRLHDLRRTFATGLQRLGVRFEVTEAALNHVGGARAGVAGIYQRHDWESEKRKAMADWSAHLSELLSLRI
jgi:integrase